MYGTASISNLEEVIIREEEAVKLLHEPTAVCTK